MKKLFTSLVAIATMLAATGLTTLPAGAAVNLPVAPVSLVASPVIAPSSSAQIALFSFTLSNTASETLSSLMAQIDAANASTTVTGSHLASLSIYIDDGSNSFNPIPANLIGSQSAVNIGSPTTITPATTTPASGKFYVSLATSGTWSGTVPADSITATMPTNAITASANSPTSSLVSTATISAQLTPTVTTAIHNATDSVVTTVASSTTVHDSITVTGNGTTTPTGNVTLSFFNNGSCTNPVAATSSAMALSGGLLNATSFPQGPLAAGSYSFMASYAGDNNYVAASSSCEPLTVGEVTPPASGTVKVHILKYIDGLVGSTTAPNGFVYPVSEFPMTAIWQAANLNGGAMTSGTFVLGNHAGGAPDLFGADTSAMQTPAYYTTSEITNNIDSSSQTVAADQPCQNNMFQLEGYTVSNVNFADAATKTPDPTTPVFSNLTGDMYVIVWNGFCGDNIGQGNGQHDKGNHFGNGTGDNQQPGNNNGNQNGNQNNNGFHGHNLNGIINSTDKGNNSNDKGNNGNHNGNSQ